MFSLYAIQKAILSKEKEMICGGKLKDLDCNTGSVRQKITKNKIWNMK